MPRTSKYKLSPERELRNSALYEVWVDMCKKAQRQTTLLRRLKIQDSVQIVDSFRDFDKFALWARFEQGYEIGRDDEKVLVRKDYNKPYSPDNCKFVGYFEAQKFEDSSFECTPGASKATYIEQNKKTRTAKDRYGLSKTRLYEIWKGMIRRCLNFDCKDYPDYGGRGISVCDDWKYDFQKFYDWAWEHGYTPQFSLDRIDVNGNYCPENCRWASDLEQKLNQRKYNGMYTNLRLKVRDLKNVIEPLGDNVVITMIINSKYLSDVAYEQSDYPAIPLDERIDAERKR